MADEQAFIPLLIIFGAVLYLGAAFIPGVIVGGLIGAQVEGRGKGFFYCLAFAAVGAGAFYLVVGTEPKAISGYAAIAAALTVTTLIGFGLSRLGRRYQRRTVVKGAQIQKA
jgi:hypothetical protein